MNYFEKMLFIDLTCEQLGIPDTNHPEYTSTFELLTDQEQHEYTRLTHEIHQIWTYINTYTHWVSGRHGS